MICNLCPRKCGVDRKENLGYCKSGDKFMLARSGLHYWEEPCISGKNGSGAVFFSGCNLRCVYCQNNEISLHGIGVEVSEERLLEIFNDLVLQGAENINLVNPTHWAGKLVNVLKEFGGKVPVVYNSSGYEDVDTLKSLRGLVDIYLSDFKYIRSDKAKRYSNAPDYFEKVSLALKEMREQVSDTFDGSIMKSGLIIRHLILPKNTNSSIEILDWLCENMKGTYISLMAQYVPCGDLQDYPEINRRITQREYDKVVNYALDLGLEKVFIQNLKSADKKFIPCFDFTGVLDDIKTN